MKETLFSLILFLLIPFYAISANPEIILLSPNGGEKYVQGDKMIIKWQYTNSVSANPVILVLYKNGIKFDTISESANNTGIFIWDIPVNITTSERYRVRIRLKQDLSLNDFSDNDFSIISK